MDGYGRRATDPRPNVAIRTTLLFYNGIGAVAQKPDNWGVGSASHPMKIHIFSDGVLKSNFRRGYLYVVESCK